MIAELPQGGYDLAWQGHKTPFPDHSVMTVRTFVGYVAKYFPDPDPEQPIVGLWIPSPTGGFGYLLCLER